MAGFDFILEKKCYLPGDVISGVLIVVCKKDTKARNVTLKFKGKSMVYWSHGKHSHSSKLKLVRQQLTLWERQNDHDSLPVGKHSFNFTFMVPYNLPPAFKSRFGSILYWLEADLDIYGLFNKKRRFPIQVNTNYDLNLYHLLSQPQQKDAIKCYGVFEKEQVVIRTTTNKKAYSIGETIECTVNVETSCPDRYVKSIEVSLLKAVEYITRTSRKESNKFLVPNKVPICERTRETFLKTAIQVPETDPSFKTQNLYVSYFVMIKVRINGTIYDNYPEVLLPVQIGTLPIMSYS